MSSKILAGVVSLVALAMVILVVGGSALAKPGPQQPATNPFVNYLSERVPVQGPGSYRGAERPQAPTGAGETGLSELPHASAPVSNSWQLVATLPGAVVKDVSFPTALVGYAAAELGQVWKTTDGGAHWARIVNIGFPYYWYGVHAMDANTVAITGFNDNNFNGILRWSTDGGATWTPDQVLTDHGWSYRIRFADALHGLVVDGVDQQAPNRAHYTTDGGAAAADWTPVVPDPSPQGGWFWNQFSLLPNLKARVAGITYCTSPDAGATWGCRPSVDSVFDGPVFFANDLAGWVGGGSISPTVEGWLHRTTDGGTSWTGRVLDSPWPIREIRFLDSQTGWAAGGDFYSGVGGMYFSSDGGQTWGLDVNTGAEMDACDTQPAGGGQQVWCIGYTQTGGTASKVYTLIYGGATPTPTLTPTISGTPNLTGTPTQAPTCVPSPTYTPPGTPAPCSAHTAYLVNETFNDGTLGVFTSTTVLTNTGGWTPVPVPVACGVDYSAFAPGADSVSDQRLTLMNPIDISPGEMGPMLRFDHTYSFEQAGGTNNDGGVLEFSTDGGASWFDAGPYITSGGYNGTITRTGATCGGITPPFTNGQSAWVGTGSGTVWADLQSFVGQSLSIRFRLGTDCSVGSTGWFVDNVAVSFFYLYECSPTVTRSPTNPPSPTSTRTGTPTQTDTALPAVTPTECTLTFSDVPAGSTFYPYIRCLACLALINGYPDGTFRPNNDVTRGQLSKIVSNAAGFQDPQPIQMFQDVPVGSTFQVYIGRLASRGFISGYPCGGPGESCVPPNNLPYFRPNANATRGQISKIVSNAAGYDHIPVGQQFEDVPIGGTYYTYTYRLVERGVMSGYLCGSPPAGPCIPPGNLPYFRPNANATRGQTSKIVANTFFPDCNIPTR